MSYKEERWSIPDGGQFAGGLNTMARIGDSDGSIAKNIDLSDPTSLAKNPKLLIQPGLNPNGLEIVSAFKAGGSIFVQDAQGHVFVDGKFSRVLSGSNAPLRGVQYGSGSYISNGVDVRSRKSPTGVKNWGIVAPTTKPSVKLHDTLQIWDAESEMTIVDWDGYEVLVDDTDKMEGNSSAKIMVSSMALSTGPVFVWADAQPSGIDISNYNSISFWAKSNVTLNEGDLWMIIANYAAYAIPNGFLNRWSWPMPKIEADKWTNIVMRYDDTSTLEQTYTGVGELPATRFRYIGFTKLAEVKGFSLNVDDFRAVNAGALNGTYSVKYRYKNSDDSLYSAFSPVSDELVAEDADILVSSIVPSSDSQVDKVEIYRIGGNSDVWKLDGEIDAGTTEYVCEEHEDELVTADDGVDRSPPDYSNVSIQYGDRIAIGYGAKAGWSIGGQPSYFPVTNFANVGADGNDVKWLGVNGASLLVGKRDGIFKVDNVYGDVFSKPVRIRTSRGFDSYGEAIATDFGIAYWGEEGPYIWDLGQEDFIGERLVELTKNAMNVNICSYGNKIYFSFINSSTGSKHTIIYDTKFRIFWEWDNYFSSMFSDGTGVYFVYENSIYKLSTEIDTTSTATWRTKNFIRDPGSVMKYLHLSFTGTIDVGIYYDDTLKHTYTGLTPAVGDTRIVRAPSGRFRTFGLEFSFTNATIQGFGLKETKRDLYSQKSPYS